MSKGGGAAQDITPATTPTGVPQTNALQHLMDMIVNTKPKGADGTTDQTAPSGGASPNMPIASADAWMRQGAGNFAPSSSTMGMGGNKGGQSAGGASGGSSGMSKGGMGG